MEEQPIQWKEIRARATKDFYLLMALGIAILLILYLLYNEGSNGKEINDAWTEWSVKNCHNVIGAENMSIIMNGTGLNFSWGVLYKETD